jgi:hypothetical protein
MGADHRIPDAVRSEIIAEAQRLHGDVLPKADVRNAALDGYLEQLKQAYNAGILTKTEYERKVTETKRKMGQPQVRGAFDVQQALHRLADMPQLLDQATATERLAIVKSLFENIWVKNRSITSLTLRPDVGPVIAALVRVLDGVPDGLRAFHPILERPYDILWMPRKRAA